METKSCHNCGLEKPISEFYKGKNRNDGYYPWCKKCVSESGKKYRDNHKSTIKESKQIQFQMSKGLSREQAIKYIEEKENEVRLLISGYKICPECEIKKPICEFKKDEKRKDGLDYWCRQCASKYSLRRFHSEKGKEYRLKNSDKIKQNQYNYGIKYRERNAEKIREKKKQYYESYYKVVRREKMARNERERRKAGLICKLNKNMSLAIWRSLKGDKNGRRWENLVGYTLEDLKYHLKKQFKDGMSWSNYGKRGWEIDHRVPLSIFNINGVNSKGFKKAWSLENLQPLWQRDNSSKRDKLFVA